MLQNGPKAAKPQILLILKSFIVRQLINDPLHRMIHILDSIAHWTQQ